MVHERYTGSQPTSDLSHPPGGRLLLLSARPAVTFPAEERHRPSAGAKLYCLVTEAHACEQLAQGCYLEADRPRFEPATFKPSPHQQQCPSNIVECYKLNDSFDNVECCFDKVERSFNNVACCFDIVAGVDGALGSRANALQLSHTCHPIPCTCVRT